MLRTGQLCVRPETNTMAWYTDSISINWLKLIVSGSAIAVIVIRILFPDLRIDSITFGLMLVAILPWLSELIESAKFPGGWEVKFRDVKAAGDKVTSTADSAQHSGALKTPAATPSFVSVAASDPSLALVGLRIEIEQRIRKLATQHDIPNSRNSLAGLIRDLKQRELLPYEVAKGLEQLVMAGNQAAHGAKVEPQIADWAISTGPEVLSALDELL